MGTIYVVFSKGFCKEVTFKRRPKGNQGATMGHQMTANIARRRVNGSAEALPEVGACLVRSGNSKEAKVAEGQCMRGTEAENDSGRSVGPDPQEKLWSLTRGFYGNQARPWESRSMRPGCSQIFLGHLGFSMNLII